MKTIISKTYLQKLIIYVHIENEIKKRRRKSNWTHLLSSSCEIDTAADSSSSLLCAFFRSFSRHFVITHYFYTFSIRIAISRMPLGLLSCIAFEFWSLYVCTVWFWKVTLMKALAETFKEYVSSEPCIPIFISIGISWHDEICYHE